jgi:hypothetical protein
MLRSLLFCFLLVAIVSCDVDNEENLDTEKDEQPAMTVLPLNSMNLSDLSSFKTEGKNWFVAGDVYADYTDKNSFEAEEGTGVLVNKMLDAGNDRLETIFEHGDIEMEFEFMMPKGSNSGIYFQGRYKLQFFDSYGVENPSFSDVGAIYERWDDSKPEGQNGYEGHPPLINASKAPGLWQEMKVYFRAPRFDESGKKTKNARFESVYLNGVLIQDDVELTGPTRGPFLEGEAATGPLIIQGDHGNIAFKNIKYKSYTQDSLSLENLTYNYFEHPDGIAFPKFDSVKISKEGNVAFLDVDVANEKQDHYGLIFKGDLNVPKSGLYLFHTGVDDGGDLLIDNQVVVHNEGNPGYDNAYATIELEKGQHPFEFRFYDNVWSARIDIDYEGPGIYKHSLGAKPKGAQTRRKSEPILMQNVEETELVRSFVLYQGKKRTHAISVASPENIHYSYDLAEGSLLRFWRGEFADLTDMWKNRGEPQLLQPLNASIEAEDGIPLSGISSEEIKYQGLDILGDGTPLFRYSTSDVAWTDHIEPSQDGKRLSRTIQLGKGSGKHSIKIASGAIKKLPNGLYSIDGQYYIDAPKAEVQGKDLVIQSNESGAFTYELFW